MMYIVPFFSLTGLYWQFGLVLYWVTTNLWTLCQQFIMFRNWAPPETAAVVATAGVAGPGGTRISGAAGTKPRPASGTARSANGTKIANGTKSGAAAKPGSTAKPAGGTLPVNQLRSKSSGTATPGGTMKPAGTAKASSADGTQNGVAKRGGLLRLGKAKPEPEPEVEDVPVAKVVRQQQPSRQARSKRTGKR
jgi:YidC/Oxa1 family membrane protein insertase